MKFYGLHFIGNDKTPLQVRVDMRSREVFARSCPNGDWTEWRRLDVLRKEDGTLDEEVAEATHAKKADSANRLANPVKITFTGSATGKVSFDGSEDVTCNLTIPQLANYNKALEDLQRQIEDLRNSQENQGYK